MSEAGLLTRRVMMLGLAAAAVPASASAQAAAYSRVTADASALRRNGLGPYAAFIEANLSRSLSRAFAGRGAVRGAPALIVRITSVHLSSYVGSEGGGGFRFGGGGGGSTDYMQGEALVFEGRRLLKQHPQLSAIPASSGGA